MKRMLTTCLIVASLVLLRAQTQTPPPHATAPVTPEKIAQVDTLAAAEYASDPVGGLTAGTVEGPKLVWTKSYGFAEAENKKPSARDTVYRTGSITKQLTPTSMLQRAAQRQVHLTDPV